MKINHNLKSFGAQAERTNLVQKLLLIVDLVLFLFTFFTSFLGMDNKKRGRDDHVLGNRKDHQKIHS